MLIEHQRNCPNCDIEIEYESSWFVKAADKRNDLCSECKASKTQRNRRAGYRRSARKRTKPWTRKCKCGCGQLSERRRHYAEGHYTTKERRRPKLANRKPIEERLLARTDEDMNGCWIWHGRKVGKGYGMMSACGKEVLVHRISYQLYVGPIPEGYHIHHTCSVRACINPEHLIVMEPTEHAKLHNENTDNG